MRNDFSPNPGAPVLIVGAAGVDIVGRVRDELLSGTSNPAQIRTSFGGVARNVSENLARLGQPVILLTAVGVDQSGEQLIEHLKSSGVNTRAIQRVDKLPTGSYLAILNSKGQLQYALDDMRVISTITGKYLRSQEALFREASLVFIDANLSKDAIRTAFSLARRAGVPVCADPTSASLAMRLQPYLSRLDLITPNHTEAGVLCSRAIDPTKRNQVIDAAKCLVSDGVRITIITLAQFGVCYATSQMSGYIPAIETEIIDPTGAGDALTAAILFGLLNDMPLDEAVRLGVSAATLTLRSSGSVLTDLSLDQLYNQLVI